MFKIKIYNLPFLLVTIIILSISCGDNGTVNQSSSSTVTDIDGNVYHIVTIGSQVWMSENLKVTHYRNGDVIPNVTDSAIWRDLTTGAYCNYNNDINNFTAYGCLYNWYALTDSRSIAPDGWHVATDEEWKQLGMYLGMSQVEADSVGYRGTDVGGKLKDTGTTHWSSPNVGATNESGFAALPSGSRTGRGHFASINDYTYFWSSSEYYVVGAWYRLLGFSNSDFYRDKFDKGRGHSVRCVKD